ncbi:MAG: hypothetical protein V1772_02275 [Chloroflexota bacterium]
MFREGVINFHEHRRDGLLAENAAHGIAVSVPLPGTIDTRARPDL